MSHFYFQLDRPTMLRRGCTAPRDPRAATTPPARPTAGSSCSPAPRPSSPLRDSPPPTRPTPGAPGASRLYSMQTNKTQKEIVQRKKRVSLSRTTELRRPRRGRVQDQQDGPPAPPLVRREGLCAHLQPEPRLVRVRRRDLVRPQRAGENPGLTKEKLKQKEKVHV